jgi:mono/diheme cytochrome c family protein
MKRTGWTRCASVATILCAAALAGCSTTPPAPLALHDAPTSADATANPLAGQAEAAAAGHQLYLDYCASCHGREGRGGPAAPVISPAMRAATPGRIAYVVEHGAPSRGMPPWPQLTPTQRWQIVSWLVSAQEK